jgi:hypothetical protein
MKRSSGSRSAKRAAGQLRACVHAVEVPQEQQRQQQSCHHVTPCVVAVDVPPTAAHYDEMVVNISMMQEGCSFVLQVGGPANDTLKNSS